MYNDCNKSSNICIDPNIQPKLIIETTTTRWYTLFICSGARHRAHYVSHVRIQHKIVWKYVGVHTVAMHLYIWMSICWSICLHVYLSVYPNVYQSVYFHSSHELLHFSQDYCSQGSYKQKSSVNTQRKLFSSVDHTLARFPFSTFTGELLPLYISKRDHR